MRRVDGMKVTRITRGGLSSRSWRNPGAGELKSSFLMFGRSQQKS